MTLKQQVLREVADTSGLTHGQIANRLGANEPSVRRITQQLRAAGEIHDHIGSDGAVEFHIGEREHYGK